MIRLLILLFSLSLIAPTYAKRVEIVLWHSMAGHLGAEIQKIATGFNRSQADFLLTPIYKGNYVESLTSFAAAFRAKQPPALLQVYEVGTATMLYPTGIIKPVDELMREQGEQLPETSFFKLVLANYSKNGRLLAMPFNISVPVIFYNADVLAKFGYRAANFPRTWDELERLAAKLKQGGYACAFTTTYPSWILIESFSALHGLPMMDITTQKAKYNNKQIVDHLTRLLRWQRLGYFEYGGRMDDAASLFTSGRCPMMGQSTGGYASLSGLVTFHVGLATLPLDNHASVQRFNNALGGAALWAVAGQTPQVYQGIAKFLTYLATPAVQKQWHQNTGYFPLGTEGIYKTIAKESYSPLLLLAKSELGAISNQDTMSSIHYGAQSQIRAINDEALEAIFAGIESPQQAMDEAVERANYALLRFNRNTRD